MSPRSISRVQNLFSQEQLFLVEIHISMPISSFRELLLQVCLIQYFPKLGVRLVF